VRTGNSLVTHHDDIRNGQLHAPESLDILFSVFSGNLGAAGEGAIVNDDPASGITHINPPELGTPAGYSQIVQVSAGRMVFIAGQTAVDRDGNVVGKNDFVAQAEQVFRNLGIALHAAGCTASNLVKLTVFLRNMDHLPIYREARNRFFATSTSPAAPAITLVEVSKLYGPDFMIEIEAVAAA
jgi:enamine deaminase RidA (YjgF/YER057c/UK114 family)